MKRFSGGFLISINLPATDFKYLIRNLIFNSLRFEVIAFKQCLPLDNSHDLEPPDCCFGNYIAMVTTVHLINTFVISYIEFAFDLG